MRITLATVLALVLSCTLCPAMLDYQVAPAAQPEQVTLRGSYLCLHGQMGRSKDHIGAFYAFEGPDDVKAAVKKVVEAFPEKGLDVASFAKFQEVIDRELLYHVTPNDVEKKNHKECEHWAAEAEITGTVTVKDGQRWITPSKITIVANVKIPAPFCQPDQPALQPKGEPLVLKVNDTLTIKCVPIPAGSYIRGSPFYQLPRCHDEFPHECVLTRDFYMAETPTTQEVFEALLGNNPTPPARRGPQFPVEYPTFGDMAKFCQILSEKNGRTVRLPTSAEWEYAARVGTSSACFPAKYKKQYSQIGNKAAKAVAVKTKEPNAWGLYDMLTVNGWHTCQDWSHGHFSAKKLVDPLGPPQSTYQKGTRQSLGGDQRGPHPPIHYWCGDGGIKGAPDGHYVGIFRVVVEAPAKKDAECR